jgi:hypothetical protein
MPFRRIWVKDVANNQLIMSHHISPKLVFFMTSSKNDQDTESKVFEMSNLKRMHVYFCW